MIQSGATCLPTDCCFIELVRHDLAEKLQQQSFTEAITL
jgi:hypothetical protein